MKNDLETRLALLKKYYAYDEASKTFNIVLHYEKVSDILSKEVKSISEVPLMSEEFLNKVSYILEDIPKNYHANISLCIDDYEGYDEKVIMDSFNDMLEFGRIKYNAENRKKYYKVATLLVVGLVLLFFGIYVSLEQWWHLFDKEQLVGELLSNFLEIAGWVFCWEAVTILFLEENENMRKGSSIIYKLNCISLLDKDNKILLNEEYEQIQKHFHKNTPLNRAGNLLLLFSGFAFIGLALMMSIRMIPTFKVGTLYLGAAYIVLNIIWVILLFVSGLFSIKLYAGKEKYRIPAIVFLAINFIVSIVVLVLNVINISVTYLTAMSVISLTIEVAHCLGYFFTVNYKKKRLQSFLS